MPSGPLTFDATSDTLKSAIIYPYPKNIPTPPPDEEPPV